MESAEGMKNRNSGQTLNTREKPALFLLKLLGFVCIFLFLESGGAMAQWPFPRYASDCRSLTTLMRRDETVCALY